MNNIAPDAMLPTASLDEISMSWLLITAAGIMIFSLIEAWLATLIIYGDVKALKKIFPATQNLIRSHVDYTIMTALIGFVYFSCLHLNIVLPDAIIVILCIGVIYNPLGFFVKAINPKAGQSETLAGKISVCVGFLPTTIGFGYVMFAIVAALV